MHFFRLGMAAVALCLASSCASAPDRYRYRYTVGDLDRGGISVQRKLYNESLERASSRPQIVAPLGLNNHAGQLSYAGVLARAQVSNPSILAARAEAEAAWLVRSQKEEFPDPTFKFGYFAEEVRTRTGDQVLSIGITQRIPWPGKLAAQGQLADLRAEAAEIKAIISARDTLIMVSKTFVEYDFLLTAVDIAEQAETAWRRVLAAAQKDPGPSRVAETLRAETELAQARFDIATWQDLAEVERARLRELLALAPTTILARPGPTRVVSESPDLKSLRLLATRHNQDLELARVQVRMSRQKITVAEQSDRPNFSVSGRYIATEERDVADLRYNGNDPIFVEIGVTLPLGRRARRSAVEQATRLTDAALRRQEATHLRIESGLAAAYWKVVNAQRLVRLYQDTLLPQTQRAADAAENLAQTNTNSVSGLLETVATWHHLQLAALRADADFRIATLELERRVGIPLPVPPAPHHRPSTPENNS